MKNLNQMDEYIEDKCVCVFVCMLASRCISLNLWRKIFGRHMLPGRDDGDKLLHFISSLSWTNGFKTSNIPKSMAKHHQKLHMNRHFASTHTRVIYMAFCFRQHPADWAKRKCHVKFAFFFKLSQSSSCKRS